MHWHHPVRIQIHKSAGGIGRTGMHIAERGWIVCPNGQQGDLGAQPPPDLTKSGKVGCIAGVVQRMLPVPQNITAVPPMRVLNNPGAPVPRRHMRDSQPAMAIAVPPVQFHYVVEAQVGNQVEHVVWHHNTRWYATPFRRLPHDGAKRWTMQMVKMSVGD